MPLVSERITAELIKRMQSPRGGWNRDALAALGLAWPPLRGWRKRLEQRLASGENLTTVYDPDEVWRKPQK